MLSSKLEYLTLALIYSLVTFTLLKEQVLQLLARRSFWFSCLAFCLLWTVLEIYALRHNWWQFNPEKVSGLFIGGLPIEEYLVFVLIHLSTTALWAGLERNDLD